MREEIEKYLQEYKERRLVLMMRKESLQFQIQRFQLELQATEQEIVAADGAMVALDVLLKKAGETEKEKE